MTRHAGRVAAAAALVVLCAPPALAATLSPVSTLRASGTVTGELKAGETVTVRLQASHAGGWAKIDHVVVALQLRGQPLDQLVVDPSIFLVEIVGSNTPPLSVGDPGELRGPFFQIKPAAMALTARADQLNLVIPISLRVAPPPDARLTYEAFGVDVTDTGVHFLTPPVKQARGFGWGTLAAAVLGALLIGSFAGGLFGSHRRPTPRTSVYTTIQRRIEQERARP